MKKIAIIGVPASGKTTLSVRLAAALKLPVYHLDLDYWLPGDIKRNKDQFLKIQRMRVDENLWIIEGCGSSSFEMRFAKADTIIYLNLPRLVCIWRLLKRFLTERDKHPDTPEGCLKVFNWETIKYIWSFETRKGPKIRALKNKYSIKNYHEIKNAKQLKQLLNLLQ
ncbi:MAG: hypothetical protein S4CHLAM7_00120 [Chlamydiae bacterium]|nr:hypothetical protein [Chlamydiota bacterium]